MHSYRARLQNPTVFHLLEYDSVRIEKGKTRSCLILCLYLYVPPVLIIDEYVIWWLQIAVIVVKTNGNGLKTVQFWKHFWRKRKRSHDRARPRIDAS